MKRADEITVADSEGVRLREFDLREIDAADQRSHFALKYVGRLEAMLRAVSAHVPPGGLVLEAGCAQANTGLLLAEAGYRVIALDLRCAALKYAASKYETGEFGRVCGTAERLPIKDGSCDAVLFGELIEHCAHPAEVLRSTSSCLKDSGVMLITTMNGSWLGSPDRTYSQVTAEDVANRQFGRGGEDHLFAFTLPELTGVVREAGLDVLGVERHATALHSDKLMGVKRLLSPGQLRGLSRFVCKLPIIGRLTALTFLVVAARPASRMEVAHDH